MQVFPFLENPYLSVASTASKRTHLPTSQNPRRYPNIKQTRTWPDRCCGPTPARMMKTSSRSQATKLRRQFAQCTLTRASLSAWTINFVAGSKLTPKFCQKTNHLKEPQARFGLHRQQLLLPQQAQLQIHWASTPGPLFKV